MRADGTLRPPKPPRGLVLSNGEDEPTGQSLRARSLIVEVSAGDIAVDRLTECQRDASSGLYAESMAGFLSWLAPRYGEVRKTLKEEVEEFRDGIGSGGHARTPEVVANLAVGLRNFLAYAREVEAISEAESEDIWSRGWSGLLGAAAAQSQHLMSGEPTRRYLELLSAALASSKTHVADMEGVDPDNPAAWGWRQQTVGTGTYQRDEWQPQGDRIGYADGEDLYLIPTAAYNVAKRQGSESVDGISISERTLKKRLHERGLLLTVDRKTRG